MEQNSKWGRVAALRPVVPHCPAPSADGSRDSLVSLLLAEVRSNEAGQHLVVTRRFAEPGAAVIASSAVSLIAEGAGSAAADPAQWLFLDTETTGLAGGTGTYPFLIGLGWWEEDCFAVEQYFMRDHGEEQSMLLGVAARLAQRRVLVTFNGKSFDWPLLETRYRLTRRYGAQPPIAHLDFLYPARQLWRLRLKSVALSEIERHILSLDRDGDIAAETIPGRYFNYLRTGAASPIAEVFRHNEMDLRGLATLAVTVAGLLADPENSGCGAPELFGLSRILQRRGRHPSAALLYSRALAGGLPEEAGRVARRELARLARRGRDYNRANEYWQQLLDDSNDGFEAYEQLAIHYEHRAREADRALALTREALIKLCQSYHRCNIAPEVYRKRYERLQHRLQRLTQKVSDHR